MASFDLHFDDVEARELTARLPSEALRGLELGAATAGFQCEGGYNGEGGPRNNWYGWEGRPGVIRSGGACGFWERFADDARLLAGNELHVFRLSLEWARVQPRAPGSNDDGFDHSAIDRYAEILAALTRAGVEPLITLYHWTHPAWLGADFWLEENSPQQLADYLAGFLPRLLDALDARGCAPPRRFITLNEPNMFALATYLAGRFPHRAQGADAARRCMEHELLGHLAAAAQLRKLYSARGLAPPAISLNNNFSAVYRLDALFTDLLCAPQTGISRDDLEDHLDAREKSLARAMLESEGPITTARQLVRWLFRSLEGWARGGLRSNRFPRLIDAVYRSEGPALDYLAFDYYDPFPWNIVGPPTRGTDRELAPVVDEWDWKPHPRGLSTALAFYAQSAPGLPVWLMENGMAIRGLGTRAFPRADGARRDLFLQAHLYELLRALANGVPVRGYLHWSLWDNYEWGSYQPRFGLIGMDCAGNQTDRRLTDAAGAPALESLAAISRALRAGDRTALAAALIARRP